MWYEHGQTEQLINLDQVVRIRICHTRDAIRMDTISDGFIIIDFEDEAEVAEVYQILRAKVLGIDLGMREILTGDNPQIMIPNLEDLT